MFLDDELEKIYNETKDETVLSQCQKLINACCKRLESPNNEEGLQNFINSFKRTDASWRLFCSKHNEFMEDGFRDLIIDQIGEDIKKWLLEKRGKA